MKYNQIRCLTNCGVEVKVVPWDYDFLTDAEPYDGTFVSNGPGNLTMVKITIDRLRIAMEELTAGATMSTMKYGNHGENIPCTDALSGRCYITSQNHGYQVDMDSMFLFKILRIVHLLDSTSSLVSIDMTGGKKEDNKKQIPHANVTKVVILGLSGLSIGQAGEFELLSLRRSKHSGGRHLYHYSQPIYYYHCYVQGSHGQSVLPSCHPRVCSKDY